MLDRQGINAGVARQKAAMRQRGSARRGSTGMRKTHSLDPQLFYNTVAMGREKYGINNIFDEPEFVADCERHHDWFKVPQDDGNRVCMAPAGGGRPRTRFGRVKERVTIRDGKMFTEKFA